MANEKNISRMFHLVKANIADKSSLAQNAIDTVVNTAKPTLMGSDNVNSVDYAIHAAVNATLPAGKTFKGEILESIDREKGENAIRCQRGQAVCTSGYGFCGHVIHVVGAKNDGERRWIGECSSSRIETLESCYYSVVERIKENPDIKNVAVPIIGAGEYKVPFEVAAKVAIAGMGNALVEWKSQDPEFFETAAIENIYFYVYHSEEWICDRNFEITKKIWGKFEKVFKKNRKVVFQSSAKAQLRCILEISRYDNARGYFAIAKSVRLLLMWVRLLFLPITLLKDLFGGNNWERRRKTVEWIALVKMVIPLFCFWMWGKADIMNAAGNWLKYIVPCLLVYHMADTITYLLNLIFLTDIQRPSANVVRSMIMLLINYLEVAFEMAFLYFMVYGKRVILNEALAFGLLGETAEGAAFNVVVDNAFRYANIGVRFFFVSLVFGYLANHMKQRKFKS